MLWLCRCGLSQLENLAALPALQELYLAFNDLASLARLLDEKTGPLAKCFLRAKKRVLARAKEHPEKSLQSTMKASKPLME